MISKLLKKNWQYLVFNTLLIIIFILFYGRFGSIMVDSFREAYIPEQVFNGKVLYKDIFVIYSPFAYLFNSFLYRLFGINLKILYFAGFFATFGILNLCFKISNKFMPKTCSLIVVLFVIASSVLSPNVFNFIFPYSFGMIYGILFILGSVYAVLKRNHLAAYFLYSMAVCSKYEFIFLLPVILWSDWEYERFKNLWKKLFAFLLPIISTIGILLFQKAGIHDVLVSLSMMTKMASAKTIYWFYSYSGLIFSHKLVPIYLKNIFIAAIPLIVLNYFRHWLVYAALVVYYLIFISPLNFIFLFLLILGLFICKFKELNTKKRIFIVSSLLVSVKVFWSLVIQSYGTYFLPFGLIALYMLTPKNIKKNFMKLILVMSVVFCIYNAQALFDKNIEIKTPKGVIRVEKDKQSVSELIEYINKNTDNDDSVVVYPECLAVNFLANRVSDNKFYSLIPLYTETFGENVIIQRLKIIKPEYIVISNYDTSDYYFKEFGKDYGAEIKEYVESVYKKDIEIGQDLVFTIYKLK